MWLPYVAERGAFLLSRRQFFVQFFLGRLAGLGQALCGVYVENVALGIGRYTTARPPK